MEQIVVYESKVKDGTCQYILSRTIAEGTASYSAFYQLPDGTKHGHKLINKPEDLFSSNGKLLRNAELESFQKEMIINRAFGFMNTQGS